MTSNSRIGIIDIGSNSIRLVIYEITSQGAKRVVSEYKESARLSERIGSDGILNKDDILSIVPILAHFALLCKKLDVNSVRAVATAAIRNATNSHEIIAMLSQQIGMNIEVLSGEEEARLGFLGVINTIDIQDGIIVDIGGGSTEVTLFQGRKLRRSVSFPFGSVNTSSQFMKKGNLTDGSHLLIRRMVEDALSAHPWIQANPGLPLIGLGGTIRSLGKMSQKHQKYSLALAHNYTLQYGELDFFCNLLPNLSLEKRKKIDGLSKERADIIVPGLIILQTISEIANVSTCVISGSGLRDGLFYETIQPEAPEVPDVLESSLQNLLLLHPNAAEQHVRQVDKLAGILFDAMAPTHMLDSKLKNCLHAAALLHRIGVSVHYYQFSKHTPYMIAQARIDGFTHREIILSACIAAYKTKSRTLQMVLAHKDILAEFDELLIHKLGTLLQLAIALDRSETQPVANLKAEAIDGRLNLQISTSHSPFLELREVESLSKDFQKVFGLQITAEAEAFSTM
jgi:exopolyphosphatase/guanosine-5'-triphosphate,3'-diphosphate pyrophosphatase